MVNILNVGKLFGTRRDLYGSRCFLFGDLCNLAYPSTTGWDSLVLASTSYNIQSYFANAGTLNLGETH